MTATTAPTPARPDMRGPAGAYPRRVAEARPVPLFGRLVVFGLASIGFLVASAWVRAHGYVNPDVLRLWADVLMSWQSPDFAGDRLSTIYPQLRYYLAMAFYAVTGNPSGAGLSVFSALIGGLTAAVWWT
ncbi:MAG: hypothetical protein GVY28_13415, partial [Alphaproteobacteria bacterium]|nr:hypothetical protein [Alphaproteobacteria bacterium]